MTFNFAEMWAHMPLLGKGIALCLFLMAVSFIGVTVERIIAFARSAQESRAFAMNAGKLLETWQIADIVPLAEKYPSSALAKLFGPIIRRYNHALEELDGGGLSPVQLARSEAERRKEALGEELRRGMNVVATVGSLAPFVGLLGTVVGIIGAFQGIGAAGSAGIAPIMRGISEALIETAFGLLVAIPSVIAFNYLNARISGIETALGRSAGELLDELENHTVPSAAEQRHAA
ncbi:MAG TPA: MotA/TolQ/ExbB proton channel family protein [Polyangiaceae bacterium]|nr:MotA/TolQ/ExbB proton channel family protein [Polyangiaceae bacterium]